MKIKGLVTIDFLNRSAQELPVEFRRTAICACDYVKVASEVIGKPDKSEIKTARGNLKAQYELLVAAAKARKFGPAKSIGPFDIVNFLIR